MEDQETRNITIKVEQSNGRKSTSKGKDFWEVVDTNKKKYRVWSEQLYDQLRPGYEYDVSINEFSDSFVDLKGKNVSYTLKSIVKIIGDPHSVEYSDEEPLDRAIGKEEINEQVGIGRKYDEADRPDWDAIARGKVRNSVASAVLENQGLVECTGEMQAVMEQWVDYIMEGIKSGS